MFLSAGRRGEKVVVAMEWQPEAGKSQEFFLIPRPFQFNIVQLQLQHSKILKLNQHLPTGLRNGGLLGPNRFQLATCGVGAGRKELKWLRRGHDSPGLSRPTAPASEREPSEVDPPCLGMQYSVDLGMT